MATERLSPQHLSSLPEPQFVAALTGIFEHTDWVSQRAWKRRPFPTLQALEQALEAELHQASQAEQQALIQAHPELAGKAAIRGELTAESTDEQANAGLTACTPEEYAHLQELNRAYRERFGHPFILAVRGLSRQDIIRNFESRLNNSPDQEFSEALRQIARIAALRLRERLVEDA